MQCPICSKNFPPEIIESHVNTCLDTQQAIEDEKIAQSLNNFPALPKSDYRSEGPLQLTFPLKYQGNISTNYSSGPSSTKSVIIPEDPSFDPRGGPVLKSRGPVVEVPDTKSPALAAVPPSRKPSEWVVETANQIISADRDIASMLHEEEAKQRSQQSTESHLINSLQPESREYIFDEVCRAQIVMELPRRFRGAEPQLLYSTQKHGISQRTFFHKAKNYPFTLLVIKDTKGHIFGGFATELWKISPQKFYGTGESFLFTLRPTMQIFRWSHLNDYFMYSDEKCIGFGGGGAGFGLWIDHEFNVGASKASATYLNTTLSSTLDFTCLHLELWAVRPFA